MGTLKELQYLSLVSKVTAGERCLPERPPCMLAHDAVRQRRHHIRYFTLLLHIPPPRATPSTPPLTVHFRPCDCWLAELENNLGISEKTLSEFIIDLAKGKKTVKEFKAALDANDAEFPISLVETLWGIIQRLQVPSRHSCCTLRTACNGPYPRARLI